VEEQPILVALASVLVLGIGSQWLASRLKLPSILLLIIAGIIAGPVTGFIDPTELFGDLLLPMVSLAIAVILFEGAMTLKLSELKLIGRPLFMILTLGVALTWGLTAAGAYYVLQFGVSESIVLGAVLSVTGPTVVGPLLQHIRPIGKVGPLARWEGIVVDPIGAVLAVLTFAATRAARTSQLDAAAMDAAKGFFVTFLIGTVLGLVAAFILREVLKRHWVSDHLDTPLALGFVILTFTAANVLHHEAGLVAVTAMGLALANQRSVSVTRILHFKENLTVLLISSLFIVLTARLNLQSIGDFGWRGIAFLAVVILLVRPISVMLSTLGCGLPMNERLFLSWLAPRGIVAAAVASVFAADMPNGDQFVAAAFIVIVGTVVVYGLTAGQLARKLGLSVANPQGILIASAHPGARAVAKALLAQEIPVRVVDTNRQNIRAAQMEGIPTFFGNILSEQVDDIDLGGIGKFFAMTRNSEVNLLAIQRGHELFDRKECYRLSIPTAGSGKREVGHEALMGRVLFDEDVTYEELDRRFAVGSVVKATKLSDEFTIDHFKTKYPEALPLFVLDSDRTLTVITTDAEVEPSPSDTVIALVPE
jgi:NhaP-type Na+/H+ or K+/H+ antiporter